MPPPAQNPPKGRAPGLLAPPGRCAPAPRPAGEGGPAAKRHPPGRVPGLRPLARTHPDQLHQQPCAIGIRHGPGAHSGPKRIDHSRVNRRLIPPVRFLLFWGLLDRWQALSGRWRHPREIHAPRRQPQLGLDARTKHPPQCTTVTNDNGIDRASCPRGWGSVKNWTTQCPNPTYTRHPVDPRLAARHRLVYIQYIQTRVPK